MKKLFFLFVFLYVLNISNSTRANDTVNLVSKDEVRVVVDKNIARLSKTLNDLFVDYKGSQDIPLPTINGKVLGVLVPLMQELGKLRGVAPFSLSDSFQPKVNSILSRESNDIVIEVLLAAHYLDLPAITEGVATLIVNRFPKASLGRVIPLIEKIASGKNDKEKNDAKGALAKEFPYLQPISKDLFQVIMRQMIPASLKIENKTLAKLKITFYYQEGRKQPVMKEIEPGKSLISRGDFTFIDRIDFQSLGWVNSAVLSITRTNVFLEWNKLNKQFIQKQMLMIVEPNKYWGVRGPGLLLTWGAGAMGATKETYEEVISISKP